MWASTADKLIKTVTGIMKTAIDGFKKKSTSRSARHHCPFLPLLCFARFSVSPRSKRHQSLSVFAAYR